MRLQRVPAVAALGAGTLATGRRGPASALLSASVARGRVEVLQILRSKDALVFTVALPVVMLALLASIFSGFVVGTRVTYSQLFTAGLLAGGLASTSFLNVGISIATERDNGALKRLAGSPMPRGAYFAGKVVAVVVLSGLEVTAMMLIGRLAYGISLPSSPGRWWTFLWVTVLGGAAMTLVGVAASSLPRTARSAAAVLNLPFLVLEFISGVFVPFTSLSHGLYSFAGLFPLRWIAEGYRSALLPSNFAQVEPGHLWDHRQMAVALLLWCVVGLAVSLRTFRWTGPGER